MSSTRICILFLAAVLTAGPAVAAAGPGAALTQRVDVREFGARGDGVSDDTAAFQRALDVCTGKVGCTVAVAAGRYLCRTLRIPSGCVLQGVGTMPDGVPGPGFSPASVLILAPHTDADLLVNREPKSGDHGIQIRLLTLEGQSALQRHGANPCHGVHFTHVTSSVVEGCLIRDFEMDGVYLGTPGSTFGPSDHNTVRKCRVADNLRNGISITRGRGNLIEECLVEGNNRGAEREPRVYGAGAIDVEPNGAEDDCSNTTIRGCIVQGNHFTGIQCIGPGRRDGLAIERCRVEGSEQNGITLAGFGDMAFAVRDSQVLRSQRVGIYVGGAVRAVIRGNVIESNGGHGVEFDNGASDSDAQGNTIRANRGRPIAYTPSAKSSGRAVNSISQ